MNLTFITGNQGKADFLAKHVNFPIKHQKIDIDEIQSIELREIAVNKAEQAYEIVKSPVLVEDVALIFEALGKLPGPFIKWFELELGAEGICELVDGLASRRAIARVCFVYFDGREKKIFEGELKGEIAEAPRGNNGFGFDPILIPAGLVKTLAEMNDDELERHSLRTTTVYPQIREFLATLDKK